MNPRAACRFVAYYRVSTDRQGRSGLGLEAQRKAVTDYLNGGAWELVGEFIEVESGKRSDRPQLVLALEACRKHKARLVIAKLDRLSRNLAFIAALMEAGVEFVAADMPFANKLTIHILAAVAEHEREAISERTKAALAAAKAHGTRLGTPDPAGAVSRMGAALKAKAATFAANVLPIIREAQTAGHTSCNSIAGQLNARKIATARGGRWTHVQVRQILERSAVAAGDERPPGRKKDSHLWPSMSSIRSLSATDLGDRKTRTRIAKIRKEAMQQQGGAARTKFVIYFTTLDKPMVLNATNKITLVDVLGRNPADWIGAEVGLWAADTAYAGKPTKGLRLRVLNKPAATAPAPQPAPQPDTSWPDQAGDPGPDFIEAAE